MTKSTKSRLRSLRELTLLAKQKDTEAQMELSRHPGLSEAERFYWLVKAAAAGLAIARQELARIQLARERGTLCQQLMAGHIDAAYTLACHPRINVLDQQCWLVHAAMLGHGPARQALAYQNVLLDSDAQNIVIDPARICIRHH